MRITLCVALLLALAVSVPVMAQTEPLNHFIGYGYINTALPIRNVGDNAVSFTFVLTNKKQEFAIYCIARGPAAQYIKGLAFRHNQRSYCIIDGKLARRHSAIYIIVTSMQLATFSARERSN